MENLILEFKELPIDGGFIDELYIKSPKRIHFDIGTFPKTLNDTGRQYDLQFYTIVDFKVNFKAAQKLRILGHDIFDTSEYLNGYKNLSRKFPFEVNRQKIRHYQLLVEEGFIDILAEGFTFTLSMETKSFIIKPSAAKGAE